MLKLRRFSDFIRALVAAHTEAGTTVLGVILAVLLVFLALALGFGVHPIWFLVLIVAAVVLVLL